MIRYCSMLAIALGHEVAHALDGTFSENINIVITAQGAMLIASTDTRLSARWAGRGKMSC